MKKAFFTLTILFFLLVALPLLGKLKNQQNSESYAFAAITPDSKQNVTQDLIFFELHGPVKRLVCESIFEPDHSSKDTIEFDREGRFVKYNGYNPFLTKEEKIEYIKTHGEGLNGYSTSEKRSLDDFVFDAGDDTVFFSRNKNGNINAVGYLYTRDFTYDCFDTYEWDSKNQQVTELYHNYCAGGSRITKYSLHPKGFRYPEEEEEIPASELFVLDGYIVGYNLSTRNIKVIECKVDKYGNWTKLVYVITSDFSVTASGEGSDYDYLKEQPDAEIKIVDLTEDASEVSIPLRKGDESAALREAINNALKELREEGTLAEISNKYFGADITAN
mgnify:CR=1 FL=1